MLEWLLNGKPTIFGTATGAIAGLAAITPAAGFVSAMPAIIIGLFASIFCYIAVAVIKPKLDYDDSLDAFGVHGISGILGIIATGLFASKTINPLGSDGLFFGNPHQLFVQTLAALVTVVYSAAVTFIIYKVVDKTIGMRVSEKEEAVGLDLSQHHEGAYTMVE
jgi:Amt family ammonium transporter